MWAHYPAAMSNSARAAVSAVIMLWVIACASPVTPTPSESPSRSVPQGTLAPSAVIARELIEARRFRENYGLRADDDWIRQVAADPSSAAGKVKYSVPLTPAEVADLDQRALAVDAIKQLVVDYGAAHPADFGGAWIDQPGGGILVAQFSAHVDEHRAALLSRVRPGAPLEVRAVSRSLAYLKAQAERLRGQDAWFRSIPAVLTSYGVDEPANQVFVRISSVNADATRLIEQHFGWQGAVTVESDGTGALLLPHGQLVVTVHDSHGNAVSHLRCVAISDLPGAYEAPTNAPTTDARGQCRLELPATGYWIRLERTIGGRGLVTVERGVVVAERTTEVLVKLVTP